MGLLGLWYVQHLIYIIKLGLVRRVRVPLQQKLYPSLPEHQKPVECLMLCVFLANSLYVVLPASVLYFSVRACQRPNLWFWVGAGWTGLSVMLELVSNYQFFLHLQTAQQLPSASDPECARLLAGSIHQSKRQTVKRGKPQSSQRVCSPEYEVDSGPDPEMRTCSSS